MVISTILCIWLAYFPYGLALGKIGSGWAAWPDYTRIFVAKQIAFISLFEIAALVLGWRRFLRGSRAFFGYAYILAAPLLGAMALYRVINLI